MAQAVKTLYIIALAVTLTANDMAWLYKEDPLTAGKANATANKYLHECVRPIKPMDLTENRDIERYNEARRTFTNCINSHNKESVKLYNASRDDRERELIAQAIDEAQSDWDEYINGKKPSRMQDSSIRGSTGTNIHTVGHSDPTSITKDIKF